MKAWEVTSGAVNCRFIGEDDPKLALARWSAQQGVRIPAVRSFIDADTGIDRLEEARSGLSREVGPDANRMFLDHFLHSRQVGFSSLPDRAVRAMDELVEAGLVQPKTSPWPGVRYHFAVTPRGARYVPPAGKTGERPLF